MMRPPLFDAIESWFSKVWQEEGREGEGEGEGPVFFGGGGGGTGFHR